MESAMKRWFQHKRLWAGLFGTTAAFGLAFGQGGMDAPSGPAKVGDVITLKFRDGPDRQFKVIKVDKQPDGTYLSEVKDTKTGETITLVDKGSDPAPAKQAESPKVKESLPPKAKLQPSDPLLPPLAPSEPPADKASTTNSSKMKGSAGTTPMPDTPADPPKRPGLLQRMFGPKKPNPPANSSAATTNNAATSTPSAAPAMPPAVRPTPGLFPAPSGGTVEPPVGSTVEPPRVLPVQPVSPATPAAPLFPAPLIPSPTVPPSTTAAPEAAPRPLPPAPMIPGLPSIPIPPDGVSTHASGIVQTRYLTPETAALIKEIQPYVTTLRTARAPSERIYAMRALAGCRHASTDTVKSVIFHTCTTDPCPLVRACCIDELCKLGYFEPAFLAHLNEACDDPAEDVRNAAKEALYKMTRHN